MYSKSSHHNFVSPVKTLKMTNKSNKLRVRRHLTLDFKRAANRLIFGREAPTHKDKRRLTWSDAARILKVKVHLLKYCLSRRNQPGTCQVPFWHLASASEKSLD